MKTQLRITLALLVLSNVVWMWRYYTHDAALNLQLTLAITERDDVYRDNAFLFHELTQAISPTSYCH